MLSGGNEKEKAVRDLALTAFWVMARLAELTYTVTDGQITRPEALLTTDVQIELDGETEKAHLTLQNAKTCAPGTT
jgi:hypothetical protein